MNATLAEEFRPKQFSDDQLLSQAKAGDPQAFGELCMRYQEMLKRTIFRIIRDREDTDDIAQDTLLSAYLHLQSFQGRCKFSTWIIKIGINTSIMFIRKRNRLPKTTSALRIGDMDGMVSSEALDPNPNPEEYQIINQTHRMVDDALGRLSPSLRAMANLHYRKDALVKEAAVTLGITETAAKSRLKRARHSLSLSLTRDNVLVSARRRPGNRTEGNSHVTTLAE